MNLKTLKQDNERDTVLKKEVKPIGNKPSVKPVKKTENKENTDLNGSVYDMPVVNRLHYYFNSRHPLD